MMKTLLIILAFTGIGYGGLGETIDQFKNRYGAPIESGKGTERGQAYRAVYEVKEVRIIASFDAKFRCYELTYENVKLLEVAKTIRDSNTKPYETEWQPAVDVDGKPTSKEGEWDWSLKHSEKANGAVRTATYDVEKQTVHLVDYGLYVIAVGLWKEAE